MGNPVYEGCLSTLAAASDGDVAMEEKAYTLEAVAEPDETLI